MVGDFVGGPPARFGQFLGQLVEDRAFVGIEALELAAGGHGCEASPRLDRQLVKRKVVGDE